MKFTVRVWDEAIYENEADTLEQAEEKACEYFDERYHATEVLKTEEEEE